MNVRSYLSVIFTIALTISACEKENETDQEKPVIDMNINGAFPLDCDTLYFGETFTFKAKFSDNAELGSTNAFSIDIHNNFDHHSHSTNTASCTMDPVKTPVNPYVYLESFDIPEGVSEYTATISIELPKSNSSSDDFESGDYHFFISLADKEGWSTQRGMNIKILHR